MTEENQGIEKVEEVDNVEVIEKKPSKGVLIAAATAAGLGIACGIKWLIGNIIKKASDYCDIEDDDDFVEEEESLEIDITEE